LFVIQAIYKKREPPTKQMRQTSRTLFYPEVVADITTRN